MSQQVQIKIGGQTISVPEFTPGLFGKLGYEYVSNPATMQSAVTPTTAGSSAGQTAPAKSSPGIMGAPVQQPYTNNPATMQSMAPQQSSSTSALDKAVAEGTLYKSASGLYLPTNKVKSELTSTPITKPATPLENKYNEIVSSSDKQREAEITQQKLLEEQQAKDRKQAEAELYDTSIRKQIEDLKASMEDTKPKAFSQYEETMKLIEQHNVASIDSRLNALKTEMRELEESGFYEMKKQERRPGATIGSVSAKQMEMQRNVNEQLDVLRRQYDTALDEKTTVMNMIGLTIDAKKYDYETAYRDYTDS